MFILKALWFLLPACFANMAPILAAKIFPQWNTPVDFGRSWRDNKIFGSHKTYRGVISGIVAGFLVFGIQQVLYVYYLSFRELSFFNYAEVSPLFGAWIGLSALLGDLIKSFFKRRFSIAPGKAWVPFDQIDWIIGTLLGICIVFVPSFKLVIASFLVGSVLHLLTKYFGFVWKLNPTPL